MIPTEGFGSSSWRDRAKLDAAHRDAQSFFTPLRHYIVGSTSGRNFVDTQKRRVWSDRRRRGTILKPTREIAPVTDYVRNACCVGVFPNAPKCSRPTSSQPTSIEKLKS